MRTEKCENLALRGMKIWSMDGGAGDTYGRSPGGGGAGGDTPFFRREFFVILPQQIVASGDFFQ